MALTKAVAVDQITVVNNGVVHYRIATEVIEDGKVLSKTYHRGTLTPGQDVSDQPDNVRAICLAAWTSDVIAAYQQAIAAQHPGGQE